MTGLFHHFHHHKDKDHKEHDHHSHQAAHTAPQQRHGHFDPGDYLTDAQFEEQFPGLSCSHQHAHTAACAGGGHAVPVSACGARQTRVAPVSHCQAHAQPVHHPVQAHQCTASCQHTPAAEPKDHPQPVPQAGEQDPAFQMPDYRNYIGPATQEPGGALQSGSGPAFPEPQTSTNIAAAGLVGAAAVAAVAASQQTKPSGPPAAAPVQGYRPPEGPPPSGPHAAPVQDYRPPEGPPPGYQAPPAGPPPSEPKLLNWDAQMDPDAIGMAAAMEAMQMMKMPVPEGEETDKMDPDVIGMAAAMEAMQMMRAEGGADGMGKDKDTAATATGKPPAYTPDKPAPTTAVPDAKPKPPAGTTPAVATGAGKGKQTQTTPAAVAPVKAKVEAKPAKPSPAPAPGATSAPASARPSKPAQDADTPDGIAGLLGAGSSPQDKLVALAIAQAAKLFDKKNGGKPIDPAVKQMKVQALNSAANSVLRLASQYRSSGKIMPKPGEIQNLINTALDLF